MKQLILAVCVVICCNQAFGMKVRERYLKYKNGHPRCIYGLSDAIPVRDLSTYFFDSLRESISHAMRHLNCTVVETVITFYTIPEKNGTYDGFIGLIQRNEIDIGSFLIRPDSVPFEPGKQTPPIVPGDISIMTRKRPAQTLQYDLTKFLDLGAIIWVYLVVCVFFMIPLIFVFVETKRDLRHNSIAMVKGYLEFCEKVFSLIIDQEQFTPSTFAGHIITFAASLFTLFAIHGLVLNTVGADLVVQSQSSIVDSLDDLVMSDLKPLMMDNLFAYYILKSSSPVSRENELWRKVQRHPGYSFIKMSFENTATIISAVEKIDAEVSAYRAAFVGPEYALQAITALSCIFKPHEMMMKSTGTLHVAKQGFAQGMLTGLMSNKIHPFTEKVISSILTCILETGQVMGLATVAKHQVSTFAQMPELKYNSTTIECLEKASNDNQDFMPFSLHRMRKLFVLLFSSLSFSFLILILEICVKSSGRDRRKRCIKPQRWASRVVPEDLAVSMVIDHP